MTRVDLASGVAALAEALRKRGVGVGLCDEIDAAQALARVRPVGREEARSTLRIALKVRRADWERLDEVLDGAWEGMQRVAGPKAGDAPPRHENRTSGIGSDRRAAGDEPPPYRNASVRAGADPPSSLGATARSAGACPPPEAAGDSAGAPGCSPEALLRHKPFEECSPDDLEAMERALARIAARLATNRSRRLVPTRTRGVPDLRRSLRRALGTEGELCALARRGRALEESRLVVLCDTSGSMDRHARFLLAFVLALRRAARSAEVFAFNTELVRLTPWLASGSLSATLERLAASVPDWSGGTRIGDSLARFVADHLRALVDSRTVVVILSDGLDRGEPGTLAAAMRAIQARARKVVWLNPLLGDPRYAPTARGMEAALPYVDRFLPAHDLASLEQLLPHLSA